MEEKTEAAVIPFDYERDPEPIVPDGWKEGDDLFADPSTWSGQTAQTDTGAEQTDAEADPTTVEADAEVEESSAEPEGDETEETGQSTESEATPRSRILQLKVNHESREVDVNSMTDEELTAALQKAAAFDAQREKQNEDALREKYEKTYNDMIYSGLPEAAARMIAANEAGGRTFKLEADAEPDQDSDEQEPSPTPATTGARDFNAEVSQLKALYPEVKAIPDEVALDVSRGTPLVNAYIAWKGRQSEQAAASLKRENEVLKHNAASAARAPVRATTGNGKVKQQENPWLKGFDSDVW